MAPSRELDSRARFDCAFVLRTDAFESCRPKANFINPHCFGEDFAVWLREGLSARGHTVSEPIQEDWGWALLVTSADHTFLLWLGIVDESIGASPAEWRLGVTYERGLNRLRHLFRKPNATVFSALCADLDAILSCDPRFDVLERDLPQLDIP